MQHQRYCFFATHTFQHPPSRRQTATCNQRDTYSTWMSNRGREKECRKESVPEDSRWAVFFFLRIIHQARLNSQSSVQKESVSKNWDQWTVSDMPPKAAISTIQCQVLMINMVKMKIIFMISGKYLKKKKKKVLYRNNSQNLLYCH